MWSSEVTNMIIVGIGETLYMTLVSTLLGYVLGLPMGIVLTVTDRDGIHPNAVIYKILDFMPKSCKLFVNEYPSSATSNPFE